MVIQAVSGARGRRRTTRRTAHSWLKRAALIVLLLLGALLLSILLFRFVNPPITAVMLADRLTGTTLHRQWVPLEDMSPDLPLAVISSEDGRPGFPRFVLACETRSGLALAQELSLESPVASLVGRTLHGAIEAARTVPAEIHVADPETEAAVAATCRAAKIRLRLKDDLPAVDQALDHVFGQLERLGQLSGPP